MIRILSTLFLLHAFVLSSAQSDINTDSLFAVMDRVPSYEAKQSILLENLKTVYTSQFDASIVLARRGAALAKANGDSTVQGDCLRYIGLAHAKKGNIDSASVYYYDALSLLESGGSTAELGLLYDDMARMYRKLRQSARALEYYDKALALYEEANDQEGIARILNESGVVYRDEGDLATANARFEKSLAIQRERNDSVGIGYALEFLGYNQLLLNDYAKAEDYLLQALAIREKLPDNFARMLNYTALGELYKETGTLTTSNAYFERSNELAREIKFLDIQRYNYSQILANCEALGDYTSAYLNLKAFNVLNDSLYNVQKLKAVEEITTRYETEKKEERIVQQQREIDQERREKLLYAVLFALGVVVFIGAVVFIRIRHRLNTRLLVEAQQTQILHRVLEAEERERQRIARDLHDGIVQDLTAAKRRLGGGDLTAGADLSQLDRDLSQVANEVRNLAYRMMPLTLKEFGLPKALHDLFARSTVGTGLAFDVDVMGMDERLDDRTETLVYRIAQELLNNTIKHSGATEASLLLRRSGNDLVVRYEDNGRGFDVATVTKGIGMNSLQSRVAMLGGQLQMEGGTEGGLVVYIRFSL